MANAKTVAAAESETTGEGLPDGWSWATLAEVTEQVPNVKPDEGAETEFGYVDISSIDNRRFVIAEVKWLKCKDAPSRARRPIRPNDVLFSNVRTYLRNVALVSGDCSGQICSTGFTVLRAKVVDSQYLFHYVLTDGFIDAVTPRQTGTHYPATSDKVVLGEKVPVAPLAEQRRIAAKIEELAEHVDACREHLVKVPEILRAFRQSVLATACSGRLTDDWRGKHTDTESATELVARMREVHRTAWERTELAKRRSKGITAKTGRWKEEYIEPEDPEVNDLPELPETWCLTGLEILLSTSRKGLKTGPFGSSLQKAEHRSTGIPVLGIENIAEMRFIEGSKIHISPTKADELAEFNALPDDILISRSGTVGEVCVVPAGFGEARISTNIMRVTLQRGGLLPAYFCYLFNGSPFVLRQISHLCGGSSRDFLNQNILLSLLLPLPPFEEQQEITHRVDTLLELADKIGKRVEAATKRTDKLTQAILAKAFRGELVPTEAELARKEARAYEPASVLLERIKAERAEAAAKAGPKRHAAKREKK